MVIPIFWTKYIWTKQCFDQLRIGRQIVWPLIELTGQNLFLTRQRSLTGYNFEPFMSNFQISFSSKLMFQCIAGFQSRNFKKRCRCHVYWFNARNQQQASLTLKSSIICGSSENQQCIDHKTTWIFCLRTFLNFCGQLLPST